MKALKGEKAGKEQNMRQKRIHLFLSLKRLGFLLCIFQQAEGSGLDLDQGSKLCLNAQ